MRKYYYEWDTLYLKCCICWEMLPIENFYHNKEAKFWADSRCKKCSKEKRRENRKNNKEREKARKQKRYSLHKEREWERKREWIEKMENELWFYVGNFHKRVWYYLKKYNLRPEVCSICWQWWDIDAHHSSYKDKDDWKYIVFVCRECHNNIHAWNIECPEPINLLDLIPN